MKFRTRQEALVRFCEIQVSEDHVRGVIAKIAESQPGSPVARILCRVDYSEYVKVLATCLSPHLSWEAAESAISFYETPDGQEIIKASWAMAPLFMQSVIQYLDRLVDDNDGELKL